jgi:FAD:protein FMN transferase
MTLKQRLFLFLFLFFIPVFVIWVFQDKFLVFRGETMGTTYTIKVYVDSWRSKKSLEKQITQKLHSINMTFSTWNDHSELSKFNTLKSTDFVDVSPELVGVLKTANDIYELSKGAYDPSMKPLFDLWGFGNNTIYYEIPTDDQVKEVFDYVGFNKLVIKDTKLKKNHAKFSLNLSSIVKGYGVDQIVEILTEIGVDRYMVEIGGEVRVGSSKKDSGWNIGVLNPQYFKSDNELLLTLNLKNNSIATSGDYKNYFEKDNVIYSHLFDPRIGKPISNNIASVTVIAPNCMLSDALATSLFVIGLNRGLSIVESYKDVECLFVVRQKDASLKLFSSSGFSKYVSSSQIEF